MVVRFDVFLAVETAEETPLAAAAAVVRAAVLTEVETVDLVVGEVLVGVRPTGLFAADFTELTEFETVLCVVVVARFDVFLA